MINWWNSLPALEQIFATIAIPATVVLVIQSLLLMFGLGFGGDADVNMDGHVDSMDAGSGDGLALFTVRGIVAFFAVGGWTGMVMAKYAPPWIAIVAAFLAGSVALVALAYLFKAMFKLQSSGNLDNKNAIGKAAKVYIPIPASGGGQGKITVLVQERLVELSAITREAVPLKTGEIVTICDILDDETVVVAQIESSTNNNQGGISQWIQR